MNARSQIKRGRKYDQVVDGAATVFMRDGFEGASVDDIAREAGVSKATLYSYFPDKKLLFLEVAQREIQKQTKLTLKLEDLNAAPREVLKDIGLAFTGLILSNFGLAVMRVVIAESERFPEIGQSFYEHGPKLMEDGMVAYFSLAESRGELQIDDKPFAAHQFIELCKANCFMHKLVGIRPDVTEDDAAYVVDQAVEMFVARYAAG